MTMNYVYLKSGNTYKSIPVGSSIVSQLESGVFTLKKTMDGVFLQKYSEKFEIDENVYDVTDGLSDRIMKYWECTDKSLGVLFCGKKGSGKSYSAKIIANKLNLPVILITELFYGIQEFISSLSGEAILIFDEFEKSNDIDLYQSQLLTITDGILGFTGANRKLFIFTANDSADINDNYFNRPGRIRYRMDFGGISNENMEQVVSDLLSIQYNCIKNDILNLLNSIDNVTIDIVKEIISEINMFGFDKEKIMQYLNVKFCDAVHSSNKRF